MQSNNQPSSPAPVHRLVGRMDFIYGQESDHHATYLRTKQNNPNGLRVWSGGIRRNRYLQENIEYLVKYELATITFDDSDDQGSYFVIRFNPPNAKDQMAGRDTLKGEPK